MCFMLSLCCTHGVVKHFYFKIYFGSIQAEGAKLNLLEVFATPPQNIVYLVAVAWLASS